MTRKMLILGPMVLVVTAAVIAHSRRTPPEPPPTPIEVPDARPVKPAPPDPAADRGQPGLPATPVKTDFPFLEEDVWEEIDRAAQAKPEPGDEEGFPRTLPAVAAALGRIAEALHRDPRLVPQGISFYRECAGKDTDLYSVRAVCLRDLKYWENQSGVRDDSDAVETPPEVARIVKMLPTAR